MKSLLFLATIAVFWGEVLLLQDYPMGSFLMVVYSFLCLLVSEYSKKRKLGEEKGFYVSFYFSPVIGILVAVLKD